MLKQFQVKNFKNFKDKFIFDLETSKNYTFNDECVENGVVKKSLIYGPNGCGKSNLGVAIFDIRTHLLDFGTNPVYRKNYLNVASNSDMAEFTYTCQLNNDIVKYSYGKKDVNTLVYENVKINEEDVINLDRRKNTVAEIDLKGAETLNKDLGKNMLSVVKYVKNNTVLEENLINKAFDSFLKFVDSMKLIRTIESYEEIKSDSSGLANTIIESGSIKKFETYLNNAGIKCRLVVMEKNNEKLLGFDFGNKVIEFSEEASTGTLALADQYVQLLNLNIEVQKETNKPQNTKGSFIYFDEFDAFYHQKVSKQMVKQLKEMNIQSIITTHNTSIMSNDLLRPDCYFLMNETSIDPIYKFTEKELRKAHNIEKMYKAGAFDE